MADDRLLRLVELLQTQWEQPAETNTGWELMKITRPDQLTAGRLLLGEQSGAIPQDGITVMYGAAGAGKTWLAVDMAMSVASGQPWAEGLPVTRTRTLYVSSEAPSVTWWRTASWAAHHLTDLDRLIKDGWWHFTAGQITRHTDEHTQTDYLDLDRDTITALLEYVDTHRIGLVVVDTLSTSRSGDEDNNTETNQMIRQLRPLWDQRALLLVHHPAKHDWKQPRGASSLYNAASQVLVCHRRSPLDPIEVEEQKRRGGLPWDINRRWEIIRHDHGAVIHPL